MIEMAKRQDKGVLHRNDEKWREKKKELYSLTSFIFIFIIIFASYKSSYFLFI
jgi:hypothetical protein